MPPADKPSYRLLYEVVRNGVRSRLARRVVERELGRRGPVEPGTYVVAVYFPDFPVNLYQIRQWYGPLERLAESLPVVIVARYATTARVLLDESPVPVVLARRIGEVEELLAEHPVRAVLYVNQNTRNFSAMRFRGPAHVFMSHGESDKDYMASNQLKAYDVALVAGPAAVDRLRTRLTGYDAQTRTLQVGRPQLDVEHPGPTLPRDGRIVVLYAPTWEGDRPTMSYGSVTSHGESVVDAVLTDPRYRLVFRPHPRTGISDPAAGEAVRRIGRRITAANRADPGAHHLWDRSTDFGWHTRECDVCITDISAVAYDWLPTGRPLLVTEPVAPEAVVEASRLVESLDLLPAAGPRDVAERLSTAVAGGRQAQADLVAHYYGDVSPGASMRRFVAAVSHVVAERSATRPWIEDEAPGR